MLKYFPNTKQHDSSDCAAAVISTILLVYRQEMSIMKIREIIGTDAYGTSVKGLVEGLEKLNFNTKAIRVETKDNSSRNRTCKNKRRIKSFCCYTSNNKKQEICYSRSGKRYHQANWRRI